MASVSARLVADCSVIVKWKLAGEPHATEAEELFLDWQYLVVDVIAPSLLVIELLSAFLRAYRRGRVSEAEATSYLRDLLGLPFVMREVTFPIVLKAFEIAKNHGQRSHDCIYVALAEQEGLELWTSDQRLFNALHPHFPFINWIGDYKRRRP